MKQMEQHIIHDKEQLPEASVTVPLVVPVVFHQFGYKKIMGQYEATRNPETGVTRIQFTREGGGVLQLGVAYNLTPRDVDLLQQVLGLI